MLSACLGTSLGPDGAGQGASFFLSLHSRPLLLAHLTNHTCSSCPAPRGQGPGWVGAAMDSIQGLWTQNSELDTNTFVSNED